MKAIILAAGYSTRLSPLTDHTPKPLLPFGPKTILDFILERILKLSDLDQIIIVVNSKFYSQFIEWRNQLSPMILGDRSIVLLNDGTFTNETRLGAVGGICLALDKIGYENDALIVAGDNVFEGDLQALVNLRIRHEASVIGIHKFPNLEEVRKKFGVVTLDSDNRVKEFEEKPEAPKSSLAATAIYMVRREDLKHITALYQSPHSGELNAGCIVSELLARGERIYCVDIPSWFDIGTQEDLAKAKNQFESRLFTK